MFTVDLQAATMMAHQPRIVAVSKSIGRSHQGTETLWVVSQKSNKVSVVWSTKDLSVYVINCYRLNVYCTNPIV